MASRHYTQVENTDLSECERRDDLVWTPQQHDEWHAPRLLRAVSNYVAKEIARHMRP
jgi:hypothetical protein